MIIRLKSGVSLDYTHHKVFYAIGLIAPLAEQYGITELWVTAAREHGHTTNPDPKRQFHWLPDNTCQAFDMRTHDMTGDKHDAVRVFGRILGPTFDVILENEGGDNEHIHTQYDPDRPGTAL